MLAMPALTPSDEHERIWRDLLRQADSLTHSNRWPSIPGADMWAYDAADRVAGIVRRTPGWLAIPFAQRRKAALGLHLKLSWRTARSRCARFRGRLKPLDSVGLHELPAHRDAYAHAAVTPGAAARAFMAEGVPAMRASALAVRLVWDEPWSEVRALIIACGMRPPAAGVLRTQCARDLKRHGKAAAKRLGIEAEPAGVASRRGCGVSRPARREENGPSRQKDDGYEAATDGGGPRPCPHVSG
jgi:hypothetical protein